MSDYTNLKIDGKKTAPGTAPNAIGRDWWNMQGKKCAQAIASRLDALMKAQSARMRQQVINARLYGNLQLGTGAQSAFTRAIAMSPAASRERLTYNGVQENIDTLVARVGETKPRPYFLTNGGDYRQQRKAKKLNQFIEGSFYETKAYDVGLWAFRDGLIQGDGFVHCYAQGGKLKKERVWSSELWVDEVEAQYGFPQNLDRVKLVNRDALAATVSSKKDRDAIMRATSAKDPGSSQTVSDMVTVIESWHLPTLDDNGELKGGKHAYTLATDEYMLEEPEEWKYEFFPFAHFAWNPRPMGYYSQSLAEQLQSTQFELNKLLWLQQKSMTLAGSFKLLLHVGSKVVKEHANNEVGAVINWAGQHEPKYIVPEPIHPVYFQQTAMLKEQMRELSGNSKMQTTGTKPAGELSGKAIREIEDVGSERHRSVQRANDNLYLEMAMLDICLANTEDLKPVRVPGRSDFRMLDWKKDIKEVATDAYVMQCFPVSRLPKDPAGRLATIQEYMQAGLITPRQGRRALDFPDLETVESLANAQEDLLSSVFDAIVDDGTYQPPEPTDDLVLAKEMVLEYVQKYRALGLEEEKLDMLRTFNAQVDALTQMATQMAAVQAPAGPQAVPAAPPVSEMLPNSPTIQ